MMQVPMPPTGDGNPVDSASIAQMSNDQVVIRLLNTISHLSRWLSPVHDRERLFRSPHRDQPSVKVLLIRLRGEEQRVFPQLHAIATRNRPDLDRLPPIAPTVNDHRFDREASGLEVQAEYRRLRQSTGSLLRSLPDVSWQRSGVSRRDHNVTIRELAEQLMLHDQMVLDEIDHALTAAGARQHIAAVSRASLAELQLLSPAIAKD